MSFHDNALVSNIPNWVVEPRDFVVKDTMSKGKALFAARALPRGTTLLYSPTKTFSVPGISRDPPSQFAGDEHYLARLYLPETHRTYWGSFDPESAGATIAYGARANSLTPDEDSSRYNAKLTVNSKDKQLYLITTKDLQSGDEVLINYGGYNGYGHAILDDGTTVSQSLRHRIHNVTPPEQRPKSRVIHMVPIRKKSSGNT